MKEMIVIEVSNIGTVIRHPDGCLGACRLLKNITIESQSMGIEVVFSKKGLLTKEVEDKEMPLFNEVEGEVGFVVTFPDEDDINFSFVEKRD